MLIERSMENSKCVPHVPVLVNEKEINKGALLILKAIRPTWEEENVQFKLLTDGITNKLVGCKLISGDEEDTVLVRVYGNKTDLLIDRKAETRNIILLNKAGLAPRLFATFDNGLAYEFVPGCTLSRHTVVEPKVYNLVAAEMGLLHKVKVPSEPHPTPMLWKKMQSFLDLVPEVFSDTAKHKRYEETIMSKCQIQKEITHLREKLSNIDSPVVFSHNDLLLGNVIYTEARNSVTFIDYEYAAFNYQAFDIGNHFAEFVGLDDVDYANYPKKELQCDWIRSYLSTWKDNKEVTESEINRLYMQVNKFALVSHLFWGIWGLIQAEHSYIDFDFMGYAAIRFDEYLAKKSEYLSLELPSR